MNPDPDPAWHDLIQRYVAGDATDAESAALQQALKDDAQLRRLYLDYMNLDVALEATAEAAGMLSISQLETSAAASPVRTRTSAWLQWRQLTAAAAGILIGMFCSTMVWAYVAPRFKPLVVSAVLKDSFEGRKPGLLTGLPSSPGVWSGDIAQVVTAQGELQPKGGSHMLRFLSATYPGEDARHSAWGDVYRLIDLRGQVAGPAFALRLSAQFAAAPFAADETYLCSVELCTLEGGLTDAPSPLTLPWFRENSAATAVRKIPLRGVAAWQKAMIEVPVSPQTQFVLVHLAVLKSKPYPPAEPVQFSGHYVDDMKLELITQPEK